MLSLTPVRPGQPLLTLHRLAIGIGAVPDPASADVIALMSNNEDADQPSLFGMYQPQAFLYLVDKLFPGALKSPSGISHESVKTGPDFEFEHNIVFSTAHVTKGDTELLELDAESSLAEYGLAHLLVYSYREGFLVYCVDDAEMFKSQTVKAVELGYTPALIRLMTVARTYGCKFLHLDAEGPTYDGFEEFDW